MISFLTVTGAVSCDKTLVLPSLFALVLKDATLTASSLISNTVISASDSSFSAVISAGGPTSGKIECSKLGVSGINIADSSYFTVDGISFTNCGSSNTAAVVIQNNIAAPATNGNNTMLSSLSILNSMSSGVSVSYGKRVMIMKSTISASATSGISFPLIISFISLLKYLLPVY